MTKISMQKKYRTASGHSVSILKTDARGDHPIIGIVHFGEYDSPESWTDEGVYNEGHSLNLVEVSPFDHLKIGDTVISTSPDGTSHRAKFAGVGPDGFPLVTIAATDVHLADI